MHPRPLAQIVPLAVLAALAVPAAAQLPEAPTFDLELRMWDADLTGSVNLTDGSTSAGIDLVNDLGLGGESSPEGRFLYRPKKRFYVRFAYTVLDHSGDNTITRSFDFGGETFTFSTRVASNLEIEYGRLGVAWPFLGGGAVRVGPLVEVKAFRGDAGIGAPELPVPVSETESFEGAFASGGLVAEIDLTRRLQIFGETSVLLEGDGDLTDTEIGLRILFSDSFAIAIGQRELDVRVDETRGRLDLNLDGTFFSASLRF